MSQPDDKPAVPERFMETIRDAIYRMSDVELDAARPYNGQPHTDQGERGRTRVDLTFRDVCDCFVLGWLHATGRSSLAESGTATYNDVYEPPPEGFGDPNPLAIMQNMSCEMEKRMGIYPNLSRLPSDD